MNNIKKKLSTVALIVICFLGLCALLYPTVANYWNENYTTKAVTEYVHVLNEISEEDYQKYWEEAREYNRQLSQSGNRFEFYEKHTDEYMKMLNPDGSGMIGFIDIPKLKLSLPVYHTTEPEILQTAIGHLEWTSLPTGGAGTHCCISGHRGLASAKLFTDLDELREGDQFSLTVMNEVLSYEIDQIRTVLPTEISNIDIDPDKDYCTLITCTPYGINTHRMLVRGIRIENKTFGIRVISEAVRIEPLIVAIILAIPILLALLLLVLLAGPKRDENNGTDNSAGGDGELSEEDEQWREEFLKQLTEKRK